MFRVLVPYNNESIPRQVGAVRWGGRNLCQEFTVEAQTPNEAIEKATGLFEKSGRNLPLYGGKGGKSRVVVQKEAVAATAFEPRQLAGIHNAPAHE